jgi:hypothetical protein
MLPCSSCDDRSAPGHPLFLKKVEKLPVIGREVEMAAGGKFGTGVTGMQRLTAGTGASIERTS